MRTANEYLGDLIHPDGRIYTWVIKLKDNPYYH